MPNFAQLLKSEIQRLARKEAHCALSGLRKTSAALRKTVAEQKRRIEVVERENRRLSQLAAGSPGMQTAATDQAEAVRFTARMIKGLRKRLGISQVDLARLLSVSINIVTVWENKRGRIQIRRPEVRQALLALKKTRKAEVQHQLGKNHKRIRRRTKPA